MEIQDRIRTIIKVNNLNASTFAERIGVQSSGVSHILSGRNKPSMDFIEKVLKEFPRVDAGWLITGNPPGYKQPMEKDEKRGGEPTPVRNTPDPAEEDVPITSPKSGRRIEKIVIFYDDRSFEEYVSNK